MRPLVSIHVGGLPVGWPRVRGIHQGRMRMFNPESYENWKRLVAQIAQEEIDILRKVENFPHDGPVRVCWALYVPTLDQLYRLPDHDNIEKGIMDALTGVVWPDDSPRWIREGSWTIGLARDPLLVGTHVEIFELKEARDVRNHGLGEERKRRKKDRVSS